MGNQICAPKVPIKDHILSSINIEKLENQTLDTFIDPSILISKFKEYANESISSFLDENNLDDITIKKGEYSYQMGKKVENEEVENKRDISVKDFNSIVLESLIESAKRKVNFILENVENDTHSEQLKQDLKTLEDAPKKLQDDLTHEYTYTRNDAEKKFIQRGFKKLLGDENLDVGEVDEKLPLFIPGQVSLSERIESASYFYGPILKKLTNISEVLEDKEDGTKKESLSRLTNYVLPKEYLQESEENQNNQQTNNIGISEFFTKVGIQNQEIKNKIEQEGKDTKGVNMESLKISYDHLENGVTISYKNQNQEEREIRNFDIPGVQRSIIEYQTMKPKEFFEKQGIAKDKIDDVIEEIGKSFYYQREEDVKGSEQYPKNFDKNELEIQIKRTFYRNILSELPRIRFKELSRPIKQEFLNEWKGEKQNKDGGSGNIGESIDTQLAYWLKAHEEKMPEYADFNNSIRQKATAQKTQSAITLNFTEKSSSQNKYTGYSTIQLNNHNTQKINFQEYAKKAEEYEDDNKSQSPNSSIVASALLSTIQLNNNNTQKNNTQKINFQEYAEKVEKFEDDDKSQNSNSGLLDFDNDDAMEKISQELSKEQQEKKNVDINTDKFINAVINGIDLGAIDELQQEVEQEGDNEIREKLPYKNINAIDLGAIDIDFEALQQEIKERKLKEIEQGGNRWEQHPHKSSDNNIQQEIISKSTQDDLSKSSKGDIINVKDLPLDEKTKEILKKHNEKIRNKKIEENRQKFNETFLQNGNQENISPALNVINIQDGTIKKAQNDLLKRRVSFNLNASEQKKVNTLTLDQKKNDAKKLQLDKNTRKELERNSKDIEEKEIKFREGALMACTQFLIEKAFDSKGAKYQKYAQYNLNTLSVELKCNDSQKLRSAIEQVNKKFQLHGKNNIKFSYPNKKSWIGASTVRLSFPKKFIENVHNIDLKSAFESKQCAI